MTPVPVAVAGCGSFGRHHARIYSQLPQAALAGIYDANPDRAAAVAAEFGVPVLHSLAEVAARARAVSIAVPTVAHAAVANELLAAGLDVLVEKPIAPSLEAADHMIAAAAGHGRILAVGHLERFNPAVQMVRPRLTRPLFFEVHRLSVFTPRSLDVDVLLDLMIHDLDLVLSFVNSPVSDLQGVGLAVLSRHTDIANVRLSFANGCVANLTASRVSTERVRKLRFFQPAEYVSLDLARRDAEIFRLTSAPGAPLPELAHEHLQGGEVEPVEPLKAEIESFLACVVSREAPACDGAAARAALALALRASEAIRAHREQLALADAVTR
ncbi:MAG: Gfo/Idh/MocA family oxidoreductase [Terriglobales bacterium]